MSTIICDFVDGHNGCRRVDIFMSNDLGRCWDSSRAHWESWVDQYDTFDEIVGDLRKLLEQQAVPETRGRRFYRGEFDEKFVVTFTEPDHNGDIEIRNMRN